MPATSAEPDDSAAPSRLKRLSRRGLKIALVLVALIAVLALVGGLWLRSEIRGSLPQLDGEIAAAGLSAPVSVERDGLGIPTITAENISDLSFAVGFVHGQDRFFQMDLQRRAAAGELAELAGPAALTLDRRVRVHRFRARAEQFVAESTPEAARQLDAYTRGVNAGLQSLDAAPFEYLLLRTEPQPWAATDSVLVMLAMFIDLQGIDPPWESERGLAHDLLPEPLFAFLYLAGTEWDAPLVGEPFPTPPIPGPDIVNIRTMEAWASLREESDRTQAAATDDRAPASDFMVGSNNWAVAGNQTVHGGALLASDMHLAIRLPHIWYRARFIVTGSRVTGVTLPGTPAVVAGSNGKIAWGFTNSQADWSDLVIIEPDPDDDDSYLTPDGPRRFERHTESLRANTCAGAIRCDGITEGETLEVLETIWGPVIDEDHHGRRRALRWVAHDPDAVNMELVRMAGVDTIEAAMAVAHRTGIPGQNFVVADAEGRIGWTIMGVLPRRIGFDGQVPTSWADGTRGWDGWLDPNDYPRVLEPPSGRIWTANARTVDGEDLARLGHSNMAMGARSRQIRDALFALERASEQDMLDIQLDDRALFMGTWRDLLLELLAPEVIGGNAKRAELRRLIEETWTGRASIDSTAFRLVRAFRLFTWQQVFAAITAPCKAADEEFDYSHFQGEGPLWRLVTERPANFLHPSFETWEAWLLAIVDDTIAYYTSQQDGEGGNGGSAGRGAVADDSTLTARTWGERNTVRIEHPLSAAVPFLGGWLNAPAEPLPGGGHMPRVQGVGGGASQRMAVSPGREEEGYFHMPGGQSGHPLSPHYLDGHAAWAEGRPTPFLPGPTVHTLVLKPEGQ